MQGKTVNAELIQFASLIVLALITRLLPHPPNFAPITSIALFSGIHFANKRLAMVLPLACMFITDLYIGLHALIPVVYFAFAVISLVGIYLRKLGFFSVVLSSTLFFIITNFGVWLYGYPLTLDGFIRCYVMAIPFFVSALLGDFFYSSLLQFSWQKIIVKKTYSI